jgi:hypothetical protein
MDRMTCPSCRRKFPIPANNAATCPACKTPIAITFRPARPAKVQDAEANKKATLFAFLTGGGVLTLLLIGAYFLATAKRSPNRPPLPPIAAAPLPNNRPPLAIAPAAEAPTTPVAEVDPMEPAKAPMPKFRPFTPADAGPLALDVPEDRKGLKKVVRDVSGVSPESVQAAIRKGVQYLATTNAAWLNQNQRLGVIALGGLTMMECKVQYNEPVLQKAADLTRALALSSDQTYDIALAILFLDRLANDRDKVLIQTLGARLIAGQESGGGFGYKCPILSPAETTQLLLFAQKTRPRPAPAPLDDADKKPEPTRGTNAPIVASDPLDPFAKGDPNKGMNADPTPAPPATDGDLVAQPPKIRPKNRLAGAGTIRLEKAPVAVASMSPRLLQIPLVANQGRDKHQLVLTFPEAAPTDHSNLQFAVLGLWVARRHGVAADRALFLADAHMRKMQLADGRWPYKEVHPSETMTCAGMMSLAMGHAAYQSHPGALAQALTNDLQIQHATRSLANYVSDPKDDATKDVPIVSVFFLWSVERVAVLFNLPTIEGKDWYGWGAQSLLKHQAANGSFATATYPGSAPQIDTCFALLFLVRSNLVQDISEYIQLQTPLPPRRK